MPLAERLSTADDHRGCRPRLNNPLVTIACAEALRERARALGFLALPGSRTPDYLP